MNAAIRNKRHSLNGPNLKLEPSIIVETISNAIMRIMKHSTNMNFIRRCCLKLKSTTPEESEKEIKTYLWHFLKNRYGIISEERKSHVLTAQNTDSETPITTLPFKPDTQPFWTGGSDLCDEHAICSATDVDLINIVASDSSPDPYALSLMNNAYDDENQYLLTCEPGLEQQEEFRLFLNESLPCSYLTSTPTERDGKISINDISNDPLFPSCNLRYSGLNESNDILRSTPFITETSPCGINEERLSYSWESLNSSDIQIYSSPSVTDLSVYFSRPECLDQSQLVGDIPDSEDCILKEESFAEQQSIISQQSPVISGSRIAKDSKGSAKVIDELRKKGLQDDEISVNSNGKTQEPFLDQIYHQEELAQFQTEQSLSNVIREFLESTRTSGKEIQLTLETNLNPLLETGYSKMALNSSTTSNNMIHVDKPLTVYTVSQPANLPNNEIEILFESHSNQMASSTRAMSSKAENSEKHSLITDNKIQLFENSNLKDKMSLKELACNLYKCLERRNVPGSTSKIDKQRKEYSKIMSIFPSHTTADSEIEIVDESNAEENDGTYVAQQGLCEVKGCKEVQRNQLLNTSKESPKSNHRSRVDNCGKDQDQFYDGKIISDNSTEAGDRIDGNINRDVSKGDSMTQGFESLYLMVEGRGSQKGEYMVQSCDATTLIEKREEVVGKKRKLSLETGKESNPEINFDFKVDERDFDW